MTKAQFFEKLYVKVTLCHQSEKIDPNVIRKFLKKN